MNKLGDYNKLVNKLVKKSFHSLKREKISVVERDMLSFARADYLPFLKRIRISVKLREADKEVLIGLFAHELAHFEDFKNKGYLVYFISCIFHKFSKRFRGKLEKETDRITMRKGYGRELIKATNFMNKLRSEKRKHLEEDYLSVKEIKQEMKKQK